MNTREKMSGPESVAASEAERQRAEAWLRDAFGRDSQRIARQTPPRLHARCLSAVRAEAGRGKRAPVFASPLAWASAAALVVAAAGLSLWLRGQQPAAQQSRRELVSASQSAGQQQPRKLSEQRGAPTGGGTAQIARATGERSVAQGRGTASPAQWPEVSARGQRADGQHAGGVPSAEKTTGGWQPAGREAVQPPKVTGDEPGETIVAWKLEPLGTKRRGGGVVQIMGGPLADQPLEQLTLEASALEPQATFAVLLQLRGVAAPVLIGAAVSDEFGTLQISIEVGHLGLFGADVEAVIVQDRFGQTVLQTPFWGVDGTQENN